MTSPITIALAGNPNAGKSTLFNALTGARQKVGNYPGVTVEKKEGAARFFSPDTGKQEEMYVVDLPGTYSLTAYSIEEIVARDFLVTERPDVVVNIVDASNLERNLYLTCQFLELGVPTVLALNMVDVAKSRGIEVNAGRLAELLGVYVVPLVARTGTGIDELYKAISLASAQRDSWVPRRISYGEDIDSALLDMERLVEEGGILTTTYPARWLALKHLEGDRQIRDRYAQEAGRAGKASLADRLAATAATVASHLERTLETSPEAMIADHRYGHIKSILRQDVLGFQYDTTKLYTTDKIDRVLTNRLLGPAIMALILYGLYTFTFSYSAKPVALLEVLFDWISSGADRMLPDGQIKSLLISGVIDGVGGVLGFVPLIMFMFFGISIMEDTGYLARIAFMMDRVFRIFGLHGSSVMPYIVSGGIAGGCAVPGVMASRTLKSPRERIATILTVPFMNCGAKLPVLALLIGTFFAKHQAQLLFLCTLLGWIIALLAAKLFRLTILRGRSTPFIMELPPYRLPTLRGLLIHTWEKTWEYMKKAGTVILAISILLWALMSYPGLPAARHQAYQALRTKVSATIPAAVFAELQRKDGGKTAKLPTAQQALKDRLQKIDAAEAEERLRRSLAGRLGTAMETVSRFAGFDWRTNIALIGGFAAKEVVISTLGTAYSLAGVNVEEHGSLSIALAHDPAWNPVMALALIVFLMFYAPCFVTVVCIVRETGSWKWGIFSMTFNTVFAFLLAVLVFQLGKILFSYGIFSI